MDKPKTIREAADMMRAAPMSDDEEALLDGGKHLPNDPRSADATYDDAGDEESPEIPDWVVLPQGFKFPKGRVVSFIKLRAAWTDTPGKGDRVLVLWNLNGADEKQAMSRTRGDSMRFVTELTKQMIRAVDGMKSDWTGKPCPASVDRLWDDIGAKCRQIVQNHYVKTHTMTEDERTDFFENCIVVRMAG